LALWKKVEKHRKVKKLSQIFKKARGSFSVLLRSFISYFLDRYGLGEEYLSCRESKNEQLSYHKKKYFHVKIKELCPLLEFMLSVIEGCWGESDFL